MTDHGRRVARIIPAGVPAKLKQLAASGKATPASRHKGRRPAPINTQGTISDLIEQQRR
ncbi:hypothetical protein [Mobilicoccus massiliensis]|uniref:hypothetical protein n=1 Tax=Mobilicoccus massiliensis TaxID=1522310 RepID=UPI001FEB815C|nr:hypothetical protein [Mobilicoccus massiliensis]